MKHFIVFILATFCVTSMAQEVCPPKLAPIDVTRVELKDGWLHTTGTFVNETRMIEVDYIDNRLIYDDVFSSLGQVLLSNLSEQERRIKYRHQVAIKRGIDYTITQDTAEYSVCVQDDGENVFVVFYVERYPSAGNTITQEWSYSVEIHPFGDLNDDGCVNGEDLGMMFSQWGFNGSADFNGDAIVDAADLGLLLANWNDVGCEEPEEELYNPVWESADDIIAFTIDSFVGGDTYIACLVENVTLETLKGDGLGIINDTGNNGPGFFHLFPNPGNPVYQVLGVSGWSLPRSGSADTWVVEVYDDDVLVGRTSSDSDGPVNNPDGSNNYGNSIYWNPMIEPFKIGDRWILYRWANATPDIPEYPPSRMN